MNVFIEEFEKVAYIREAKWVARKIAPDAAFIGALMGGGATIGHMYSVDNKIDAAKRGIKNEKDTVIQRNPKLTGALSLGIAPAISSVMTIKNRNDDQKAVQDVKKKHPVASYLLRH